MAKGDLRVLHSVVTYLVLTENWIYPQVVGVPGVSGGVVSDGLANYETFPLKRGPLLTPAPPPWDRALGIPRFLNAVGRRVGLGGALGVWKLRLWRPRVLHAHFGQRGWTSLGLAKRLAVPLITSFYGYDAWLLPTENPVWKDRYRELFAAGRLFLVEGPAMRDRLCALGCPAEKALVQRIGIDLGASPYEAKDFSGGLRTVMVGRFVGKKGFVNGLKACGLARSRGTRLSVTIIGDASPNDAAGQKIKEQLQVLAAKPELAGSVRFAGFLPLEQTRALVREHNVFLCPSRHAESGDAEGGAPVALTEALSAGLLCVGTRHCDIPELILDGQTGYLCPEGDVAAMADVLGAVSKNSGRLLELTKAARTHVEQNFSLSAQLEKRRAVYETVLNRV
jgi:colanic acid/amylovoran biosynthesis glycosyltransferase